MSVKYNFDNRRGKKGIENCVFSFHGDRGKGDELKKRNASGKIAQYNKIQSYCVSFGKVIFNYIAVIFNILIIFTVSLISERHCRDISTILLFPA